MRQKLRGAKLVAATLSLLKLPNDLPLVILFLQSSLGIWCSIRKSFVVSPCYQLQSEPPAVADKQ